MIELSIATIALESYRDARLAGLFDYETHSWSPSLHLNQGIASIVQHALNYALSTEVSVSVSTHEQIPVSETTNAEAFFRSFTTSAIQSKRNTAADWIIAFNLMPFSFSPAIANLLVAGFQGAVEQMSACFKRPVVFLVRNVDWFRRSPVLTGTTDQCISTQFLFIDIRGYILNLTKGQWFDIAEVPRDLFAATLAMSPETLYRSLVFETNRALGHFGLRRSHVRTHYDLTQLTQRDNVREYIFATFGKMTAGYDRIVIISVGLETNALTAIGFYLKVQMNGRIVKYLHINSDPDEKCHDEVFPAIDPTVLVVIITDILNTGETVANVVRAIKSRIKGAIALRILTIAAMSNSPDSVEGIPVTAIATIRRTYYPADRCKLCDINVPLHPVSSVRDFFNTSAGQLSPLDMWEIVHDTEALICDGKDVHGHKLPFRLKTERIFKRYRLWLRTRIRALIDSEWKSSPPNVICTVNDDAALPFAHLVAESLDLTYLEAGQLIAIDRRELASATPSKHPEHNKLTKLNSRILLVDAGISTSTTMSSLIDYCTSGRITPIGALVFVNRVDLVATRRLEQRLGGGRLISMYNWEH